MNRVIPWCTVAVLALAATGGAQPTRLWTRFLGPTNAGAQAFAVNVGADHNVYVAGKADDGFDGQPFVGPHTDAFMTKFNPDGVRAWTRLWGSSGSKNERAMGIGFDSTGRVYVAGESAGNFDGNTNGIEGYELMFLSKFTADGTRNWSRLWGDLDTVTPRRTQGYNLAVDGADCLYVVGETGGEFDGQTNAGVTDLCVSKLDASGTRLWTRIWGGGFTDHAQAASVDSAGNLYVAGATSGSGLFSGFDGQTNPSPDNFSACISKFTPNGTWLWSRIWGSIDDDRAYGVAIDKTDSVYVSGVTRGECLTNAPTRRRSMRPS